MKRLKAWQICVLLIFVGILGFSIRRDTTKLTYIETTYLPEGSKKVVKVETPGIDIVQTFIMPYELLNGISAKVKTYANDSNSTWHISLIRTATGEVVYEYDRNASQMENGAYEDLLGLSSGLSVYPGEVYELHIFSVDVSEYKKLGFYRTKKKTAEYGHLTVNGESLDGSLSLMIAGGDHDSWWIVFDAAVGIFILLLLLRLFYTMNQGRVLTEDRLLMGAAAALGSFLLLRAFANVEYITFTDEMDNFRGGLVIANGGVLYRDYVTQHTPFAYYLSAVYALMGASSAAQFRLLWYATVSLIWGLMYIRHADWYGRRVMYLVPILNILFCSTIVDKQGYMLLSDNIQGISFVILTLEFLRYMRDRKLQIGRCLIVSACIWASFGSAFVSAFALLFAGIMMILVEAGYWKDVVAGGSDAVKAAGIKVSKKASKKALKASASGRLSIISMAVRRYAAFAVTLVVPPALAGIYLIQNDAFKTAYDQMYRFNTEVYTNYSSYGSSMVQPFVSAVQGLFSIVSDRITSILNADISLMKLMQLLVMMLALMILFYRFEQKRFFDTAFLLLLLCFSATRGYETDGFHSLAAWHMAVLIIALNMDEIRQILPRLSTAAAGILTIVLLSSYVKLSSGYLLSEQETVSRMESTALSLIKADEKQLARAKALLAHPEGLPVGPILPVAESISIGASASAETEASGLANVAALTVTAPNGRSLYIPITKTYDSVGLTWLAAQFTDMGNGIYTGYTKTAGLFQDAFSYDSLYLIYKGYYPVNRTVYVLPWYMDWYENWAVADLHANLPSVVIFNDKAKAWGITEFSSYFNAILKQYYTRQSDDTSEPEYSLWVRKKKF